MWDFLWPFVLNWVGLVCVLFVYLFVYFVQHVALGVRFKFVPLSLCWYVLALAMFHTTCIFTFNLFNLSLVVYSFDCTRRWLLWDGVPSLGGVDSLRYSVSLGFLPSFWCWCVIIVVLPERSFLCVKTWCIFGDSKFFLCLE